METTCCRELNKSVIRTFKERRSETVVTSWKLLSGKRVEDNGGQLAYAAVLSSTVCYCTINYKYTLLLSGLILMFFCRVQTLAL